MSIELPSNWTHTQFREFLSESRIPGTNGAVAEKLSVKLHGRGVVRKTEIRPGSKSTKYFRRQEGQFIYSKLDFLNGALGIIPAEVDGCESTTDLPAFDVAEGAVDPYWLEAYVQRPGFYKRYRTVAKGSRRARRVSVDEFLHSWARVPPLDEQRAIASAIAKLDERITAEQHVLRYREQCHSALHRHLLYGGLPMSHEVLKETALGPLPQSWRIAEFSSVMKRVRLALKPEPNSAYTEIGVRSHGKGVFVKEACSGADIGSKRVFKVRPNTLVFNIVFAWEGAVAILDETHEGMIASHRFPMFEPRHSQTMCSEFLYWFLTTGRGVHQLGLASPGGAGRNRTLGQSALSEMPVPVPAIEVQREIADVLNKSSRLLEEQARVIEQLEDLKGVVCHRLMTGQDRLGDFAKEGSG